MEIFSWKTILSVLSQFVQGSKQEVRKVVSSLCKKGRKTWKCALMIQFQVQSVYMKYMTNL